MTHWRKKGFDWFAFVLVFAILFSVVYLVGAGYVIYHFVSKYW